ncbi:unnamed protein product [Timema podura]|nr:unnamed protein product [Timema podura]
MVAICW